MNKGSDYGYWKVFIPDVRTTVIRTYSNSCVLDLHEIFDQDQWSSICMGLIKTSAMGSGIPFSSMTSGLMLKTGKSERLMISWATDPMKYSVICNSCWVMIITRSPSSSLTASFSMPCGASMVFLMSFTSQSISRLLILVRISSSLEIILIS